MNAYFFFKWTYPTRSHPCRPLEAFVYSIVDQFYSTPGPLFSHEGCSSHCAATNMAVEKCQIRASSPFPIDKIPIDVSEGAKRSLPPAAVCRAVAVIDLAAKLTLYLLSDGIADRCLCHNVDDPLVEPDGMARCHHDKRLCRQLLLPRSTGPGYLGTVGAFGRQRLLLHCV